MGTKTLTEEGLYNLVQFLRENRLKLQNDIDEMLESEFDKESDPFDIFRRHTLRLESGLKYNIKKHEFNDDFLKKKGF